MTNNVTYKLKRGADEALRRLNPILAAGEPIVVFCSNGQIQLKIGDGKTPYTELTLSTQIPDEASIQFKDNKITLAGFESATDLTVPFKVTEDLLQWVSLDFISSNTKLNYNANTGEIELCTVNGKVVSKLDAAEFAVAGLIEDIGYDAGNNTLIFIWNTTNGTKTSTIPLNNMLSPYTEGNGIKIIDNAISIKIHPDNENYLFIDESGIGIKGIQEALDLLSVQVVSGLASIQSDIDNLKSVDTNLTKRIDNLDGELDTILDSVNSVINNGFDEFKDNVEVQLLSLDSTLQDVSNTANSNTNRISTIETNLNNLESTIEDTVTTNLTEIRDEVDTLAEALDNLNNQDIQSLIDSSLTDYVKSSDIEDAIEEAAKDLNINLDRIDGGRITNVTISES